jgi:hypothetical protein
MRSPVLGSPEANSPAGHSEHARSERSGQAIYRHAEELLLWADLADLVSLPAHLPLQHFTFAPVGMARFHHLRDAATVDDIADRQRGFSRGARPGHIHAHHRREAEIMRLQQYLAFAGLGDFGCRPREILWHHIALRPPRDAPLVIGIVIDFEVAG